MCSSDLPEQALQRAATGPFDLVLCDVRMPKMDGVTFLRRYRADGGQALLIMMSAYGSEDSALDTRFCTSTCAKLRSVPILNVTVSE